MIKDRLILLGIAGLSAVATAGWMRPPQAQATPIVSSFQPVQDTMLQPIAPGSFQGMQVSTPVGVRRSVYREAGPVQTARVRRLSNEEPTFSRRSRDASRDEIYDDGRPVTVTKERSTKESVAIIGGSAAAGAAIGAIAGGGKGAAIGALSGGAAGYIYDRMTHKKQVRAEQAGSYRAVPN